MEHDVGCMTAIRVCLQWPDNTRETWTCTKMNSWKRSSIQAVRLNEWQTDSGRQGWHLLLQPKNGGGDQKYQIIKNTQDWGSRCVCLIYCLQCSWLTLETNNYSNHSRNYNNSSTKGKVVEKLCWWNKLNVAQSCSPRCKSTTLWLRCGLDMSSSARLLNCTQMQFASHHTQLT